MTDKVQHIQDSVKGAGDGTAQASAKLMDQFISMHQGSIDRNHKDNQKNVEAMAGDKESIALHARGGSASQLTASAKDDMAGDRQAGGNGPKKPGDDQKNIAAENAILKVDNQVLQLPDLTDKQKGLVAADIASKNKNIENCAADVPKEKKYASHDQAEIKALQGGHDAKAAGAAVVADRNEDLRLEPKYIDQNNKDTAIDRSVLQGFATPKR